MNIQTKKKREYCYSVVICAYNSERYIKDCIDSVLMQLTANDELIIINDGSTDNTKKILDGYANNARIKIISNPTNFGLAVSRNIAYKSANNEIIFYIDSDTILPEGIIEKIDEYFVNNRDLSALTGQGIELNKKNKYDEWRYLFFSQTQGKIEKKNPRYLSGLCMAVKKNALLNLQGFNENYRTHAEDVDFAYKLRNAQMKYIYSPDIFVFHNRTDNEESLKKMAFNHIYWSIIVHKNNGRNYIAKYFFASFKILISQILKCVALRKFYLIDISFKIFFVRLKAILKI